MQDRKTSSFISGAAVLMAANLLVKLIGLAFKVPLTYLIGEDGMGHFSDAYTMYTWMFVLATAGLPVAVSKMVSESRALGRNAEVRRILKVSLLFLFVLGLVGTGILFLGADRLSLLIGNPKAAIGIRAIAPAMLFVALMSGFRGFFQGQQDMVPTAISEVAEALGKLIFGYALAYLFLSLGVEIGAAGAVAGVSCGAALGLLSLLVLFLVKKRKLLPASADAECASGGTLFKKLITIAIPITIGASVFSLTSVIDMAMIKHNLVAAGFSTEEAVRLWGSYSGYAVPIFNMPPTLLTAVSISLVPAIASAFVSGNRAHARGSAESAIRITTLFALPCSAGISLLATPILSLIYNNTNASSMLTILGWAIVFVSLVQITNATLQSVGKVFVPVIHMVIGGIVKILINYFLVSNPTININGAPVGTIVCYALILALNLIAIKKVMGVSYALGDMLLRPLFSTVIMGGVVLFLYRLTGGFGRLIPVVVSIAGGAIAYAVVLFAVRGIREEDVRLLPKGEKLARILKRAKLLR
ncbi:MAG: polysaccharide biosynthesis protein [Ruminococcaceae bacterium]|nr:polysaccharide biosynthesis protein [Oscillospiraceae bacterium]